MAVANKSAAREARVWPARVGHKNGWDASGSPRMLISTLEAENDCWRPIPSRRGILDTQMTRDKNMAARVGTYVHIVPQGTRGRGHQCVSVGAHA